MASRAGTGIEIDCALVPRREEGMTPYELMLSESQERMLLVVRRGCEDAVMEIFRKWDLEACVIGRVTDTGRLRVMDGTAVAADIPIAALTDEAPQYERPSKRPGWQDEVTRLEIGSVSVPDDLNGVLLRLLSSLNLCDRGWIYTQYDHMVRTDTVVPPGSDSAVIRIKGTTKALAMTVDCNSRYCFLDPFTGGAIAVAEAARNVTVSGARPLALTDCLNFGNPERPEVMWQFENSILGMREACLKLGIPVVSGNVSFYNETSGNAVYPTPTVGMVGLLDDIEKRTTQWFKDEGDLIALLGATLEEIGGSEYLKVVHSLDRGLPPRIDLDTEKKVQHACRDAIAGGIIKSAHDVSEGGLAVALAEACLSPSTPVGATVELQGGDIREDALLFGESQSRIIISLEEKDLERMKGIAAANGAPFTVIGRVGGGSLRIKGLIDLKVKELHEARSGVIEDFVK